MLSLLPTHPARRVAGYGRLLTKALKSNRLLGPTIYSDLTIEDGEQLQELSLETISDAQRLRTLVQSHAADGIVTPDELDEQIRLINEIMAQAETGEVIR